VPSVRALGTLSSITDPPFACETHACFRPEPARPAQPRDRDVRGLLGRGGEIEVSPGADTEGCNRKVRSLSMSKLGAHGRALVEATVRAMRWRYSVGRQ
jgi:hypothetical protein